MVGMSVHYAQPIKFSSVVVLPQIETYSFKPHLLFCQYLPP